MSKEAFIRGFCKAAEEHGVDPVQLAKYAAEAQARKPRKPRSPDPSFFQWLKQLLKQSGSHPTDYAPHIAIAANRDVALHHANFMHNAALASFM